MVTRFQIVIIIFLQLFWYLTHIIVFIENFIRGFQYGWMIVHRFSNNAPIGMINGGLKSLNMNNKLIQSIQVEFAMYFNNSYRIVN